MSISKLKATTTASGTINLTWMASGAAVETVVLWRPHGTGNWTGVGVSKTAAAYTITGLVGGGSYDVRVLQDTSDANATVAVPSPGTPPVEVSPPVLKVE